MNKRLEKLHKRKVARAKAKVSLSEADLRTPEQIAAAREASRPAGLRRGGPEAHYAAPSVRNHGGRAASSAAKADA